MNERTSVDTSGIETPGDLHDLMGVYCVAGTEELIRAKYDGLRAPEQVAFNLPQPIQHTGSNPWYDVNGDLAEVFFRNLSSRITRYLVPANCQISGITTVYPWSDSLEQRAGASSHMCVNPNSDAREYDWVVVDEDIRSGTAFVYQGDWDNCLFEFVNASYRQLSDLARKQLAEETEGLLPDMNKRVTVTRDHKLRAFDEEYRTRRAQLVARWATQQLELVRAEEAQWNENNDATRGYGIVLDGDNSKTPHRGRLTQNVAALMRKHELDHGSISATILWTVKEIDFTGSGEWVKYATFDASTGVWTFHF